MIIICYEKHDIIWGQGVIDLGGVLTELKRQSFKGFLSIECEYNSGNSVPDIKKNIKFFNTEVERIY